MANRMQPGMGMGPYAEEALAGHTIARGDQGMFRTSAPIGPERINSSGPTDKPEVNAQPVNNMMHKQQEMTQNISTAMTQGVSNAVRGERKNQIDESQAQFKAQEQANKYMAEILYANDGGSALMRLNSMAQDPATIKNFMQRVGEAQLMSSANNPQV